MIQMPVGLHAVTDQIRQICDNAMMYRRCNLQPSHYIINLDAGQGQSTLTTYITDMFAENHIREFGGMDEFLEFRLDGSMNQIRQMLAAIQAAAVYTNEFEGIIAMDITGLAAHINESQTAVFLQEMTRVGEHATLIFYVPGTLGRNERVLVEKLVNAVPNTRLIQLNPYTEKELAQILSRMLEEAGVDPEMSEEMDQALTQLIRERALSSIRSLKMLTGELIRCADFGAFIPELTAARVQSLLNTANVPMEGNLL